MLFVQVLVKWYNIYNAPGGPSAHAEWNLFVTCFMMLMGYNTERLTWTRNVSQVKVRTLSFSNTRDLTLISVLHTLFFPSCILKCLSRR